MTDNDSLLVIGLGMIGGSVLRSAREADPSRRILGFDADPEVIQLAHEYGFIDNSPISLAELAAEASLIVIAVPPMAFDAIFEDLARLHWRDDVAVTDVASVKQLVIRACTDKAPDLLAHFVPAHPVAGSEQSGLLASKAGLFRDKKLIISPHGGPLVDGVRERVEAFWQSLDCRLALLEPGLHDELLASTSHLPHVLAYVLVDSLLRHPNIDSLFEFAAGGFQDISRTASSDPTMWHDVFISNKAAVLEAIEQFEQRLALFKSLVKDERSVDLFAMLKNAKQGRDDYLAKYRG